MTDQRTTCVVIPGHFDLGVACDWICWWGHANGLALWAYPLEKRDDGSVEIAVAGPLPSLRAFRAALVGENDRLIMRD